MNPNKPTIIWAGNSANKAMDEMYILRNALTDQIEIFEKIYNKVNKKGGNNYRIKYWVKVIDQQLIFSFREFYDGVQTSAVEKILMTISECHGNRAIDLIDIALARMYASIDYEWKGGLLDEADVDEIADKIIKEKRRSR